MGLQTTSALSILIVFPSTHDSSSRNPAIWFAVSLQVRHIHGGLRTVGHNCCQTIFQELQTSTKKRKLLFCKWKLRRRPLVSCISKNIIIWNKQRAKFTFLVGSDAELRLTRPPWCLKRGVASAAALSWLKLQFCFKEKWTRKQMQAKLVRHH